MIEWTGMNLNQTKLPSYKIRLITIHLEGICRSIGSSSAIKQPRSQVSFPDGVCLVFESSIFCREFSDVLRWPTCSCHERSKGRHEHIAFQKDVEGLEKQILARLILFVSKYSKPDSFKMYVFTCFLRIFWKESA
jgi:hypothetical protein